MMHTPIKLEIALEVYYNANLKESSVRIRSSAHSGFLTELLHDNIVEELGNGKLKITSRGVAWVHMLRETPYPRIKECWVDPRTDDEVKLNPVL